jgi:hypothetical protein
LRTDFGPTDYSIRLFSNRPRRWDRSENAIHGKSDTICDERTIMSLLGLAAVVGWGLAIIFAAFLGSFLPGYMKKKGENLATHEDIRLLTDQVAAVTTTAKEIESKISSDVWDKQKQWELKRDVLFRATRRLAEVDDALLAINSGLQVGGDWNEAKQEKLTRWTQASTAFDESRLFVGTICVKETREAFDDVGRIVNIVAAGITHGDAQIYYTWRPEFFKALLTARLATRKELGIENSI